MRKISRTFKFVLRFGSFFTQISTLIFLIGMILSLRSISGNVNEILFAITAIIVGIILLWVSLVRANQKIRLIESGKVAKGNFKQWKNSFISRNNQVLVYLIYSFTDDRRKKREAYALSSSTNGVETAHIYYNGDHCVVLEYLPGSPRLNNNKELEISVISTIFRLIFICLFSLGIAST
ncbi:hypothetical protein D3C75_369440 [compost metagenome]